jgi:hypothetical protein
MGARVLTKLKPELCGHPAAPEGHTAARAPDRATLADRLRAASRDERCRLYTEVYSELFNSLPDHPQKAAVGSRTDRIAKQVRLLKCDAATCT